MSFDIAFLLPQIEDGMVRMKNRPIIYWLLIGCFLIFVMVIIGGITRLTHSGLSMVEWRLIMGTLPPLNEQQWLETFEKYKQFPEYQLVNFHFTLEEFKSIFWWEYIHRVIGRLIGLVFVIPFIYFWWKKRLTSSLFRKLLIILALGSLQGVLGWYMVKSGLNKRPDVSHFRLAMHLMTAFITFGYTLWVALGLIYERSPNLSRAMRGISRLLWIFLITLGIQITYGAFVAGLNAGFIYNTFPKMGDQWVAEAVTTMSPFYLNLVENIAGVQFIHRYLAYVVLILAMIIWFLARKRSLSSSQKVSLQVIALLVTVQFLLGVFTLIYAVPIAMGVIHQLGAFLLFGGAIFALHRFSAQRATS